MVIVNNAAMNIGVLVSINYCSIVLFRHIPRSGTARPYGSSSFSFLRTLHTTFQSGCTKLQSHQQCKRTSLFFTSFLILVICGLFNDSDRCEMILG